MNDWRKAKSNTIQERWSNKQCVKLQDSVNSFTIAYHSLPQFTMAQWLNAACYSSHTMPYDHLMDISKTIAKASNKWINERASERARNTHFFFNFYFYCEYKKSFVCCFLPMLNGAGTVTKQQCNCVCMCICYLTVWTLWFFHRSLLHSTFFHCSIGLVFYSLARLSSAFARSPYIFVCVCVDQQRLYSKKVLFYHYSPMNNMRPHFTYTFMLSDGAEELFLT